MNTNTKNLEDSNYLLGAWGDREQKFPGWHGFSKDAVDGKQTALFFSPGTDPSALLRALASSGLKNVTTRVVHTPPFKKISTSTMVSGVSTLRPGSGVFSASSNCGQGPTGTIGAFLRPVTTKTTDPRWLLSSHHILVGATCPSGIQIRRDTGEVISTTVKSVPLQEHDNKVEAAVAQLKDSLDLTPVYPGLSITSVEPAEPVEGSTVSKLGMATGITQGEVLHSSSRFDVDLEGDGGVTEFIDQIVIRSVEGTPFLATGDSGSLVVSNGQPLGLLFAMSEGDNEEGSPFGLASPFGNVLKEVNKVVAGALQLML